MSHEYDAVQGENDVLTQTAPLAHKHEVTESAHKMTSSARGAGMGAELSENGPHTMGELYTAKSLQEFVVLLGSHEVHEGAKPLLGISAGEFELACESLLAGIFAESIESKAFTADELIAARIKMFVLQLGLPNDTKLCEHIALLIFGAYKVRRTPDMIAPLRSEFVQTLNSVETLDAFEHALYEELPLERAGYISKRLQHILQGTAVQFASGNHIQQTEVGNGSGGWWNDPTAEVHLARNLEGYAPFLALLDCTHLARLLLSWTFSDDGLVVPRGGHIPDSTKEAERKIKGMEEFDELRPPLKSEETSVPQRFPEME